jgi:hypothetical protein
MYRYFVSGVNESDRLIALRDPDGRHHIAHCTSDLPPVESELHGPPAAVGFALLIGADGKVCRLIFSQINCSARSALRPCHGVPGRYQNDRISRAPSRSGPA